MRLEEAACAGRSSQGAAITRACIDTRMKAKKSVKCVYRVTDEKKNEE